jgi:hypothetical protein
MGRKVELQEKPLSPAAELRWRTDWVPVVEAFAALQRALAVVEQRLVQALREQDGCADMVLDAQRLRWVRPPSVSRNGAEGHAVEE